MASLAKMRMSLPSTCTKQFIQVLRSFSSTLRVDLSSVQGYNNFENTNTSLILSYVHIHCKMLSLD